MDLPSKPIECNPSIAGSVCASPTVIEIISKKISKGGKGVSNDSPVAIIEMAKTVTECDTESCVVRKILPSSAADTELKTRFKPTGPRIGEQLLDNFNIDEVLAQYAQKHKEFKHIPFQMIDFNERGTELSKINLSKLIESGVKSVGCVLNTDTSAPGHHGIHWFAIYCDLSRTGTALDPYTIEYFNSSGNLPMEQVQIWANQKKHELENSIRHVRCEIIIASRVRQQSDEHSCGPYSLYYIISRLEGTPWRWFGTHSITDAKMHEFRRHLFRESD